MEIALLTAFDVVWFMFGFILIFIAVVVPCIGIIRWLLNNKQRSSYGKSICRK